MICICCNDKTYISMLFRGHKPVSICSKCIIQSIEYASAEIKIHGYNILESSGLIEELESSIRSRFYDAMYEWTIKNKKRDVK